MSKRPDSSFGEPPRPPLSESTDPVRLRRIGSLVNQLISARGYAQVAIVSEMETTIVSVLEESIRNGVRVGNLKRGVLSVYAKDSVTLQELNFQKRTILKRLGVEHPQSKVTDLKFRIQS